MGWKEKLISKAGREILIKTIGQAIPTYSMSLFKLPNAICDKINSLLSNYWWGQTKDEKKICWINWKNCVKIRRETWDSEIYQLSIWQCWLSKYGGLFIMNNHFSIGCTRRGIFLTVASWWQSWAPVSCVKSLLAAREVIKEGSTW